MTEKQQEQADNGEIDEGKLGSLLSNIKLFVCMYVYDKLTKRNGIYNTLFHRALQFSSSSIQLLTKLLGYKPIIKNS